MNRKIHHFLILIPVVLIVEIEYISEQFSEQQVIQIEAKPDAISASYDIPSIGYSIVLKSGAVGCENLEEGLPKGLQIVYRGGSVTKSFKYDQC